MDAAKNVTAGFFTGFQTDVEYIAGPLPVTVALGT
jgi:hypothetical protein